MPGSLTRVRAILPIAAALVALVAACSSAPTSPPPVTPPPTDPTPPPPNAAPVISSLVPNSPRVEADTDLTLTASVQDAETPIDQLVFGWSATPVNGAFTVTGAQARWRAPRAERTPDLYTVKLVVTERYTSGTQMLENQTSKSIDVHYNDSPAEITHISNHFLTELFPDFSVTATAAVQDFTDNCTGKADEMSDVANNRINFHILSGTFTNIEVDVSADRTSADVSGNCTFVDIPTNASNPNAGRRESVSGVCTLTAVYENWRWFLCTSHFRGLAVEPLNQLRYRVPGQIVSAR